MIIMFFRIKQTNKKFGFFQRIFSLTNFIIYIVLKIDFINLNNVKINFRD